MHGQYIQFRKFEVIISLHVDTCTVYFNLCDRSQFFLSPKIKCVIRLAFGLSECGGNSLSVVSMATRTDSHIFSFSKVIQTNSTCLKIRNRLSNQKLPIVHSS